jgi:hypothetical protein
MGLKMTEHKNTAARPSGGLSRRTVVKGAAWSVPVMMVGSAAPAMAMSPFLSFNGDACKNPGKSCKDFPKSYTYGLAATPIGGVPICIRITKVEVATDPGSSNFVEATKVDILNVTSGIVLNGCDCGGANGTIAWLEVNSPGTFELTAGEYGDSNNSEMRITYTAYIPGSGCTVIDPPGEDVVIRSGEKTTNPCEFCPDDERPTAITGLSPNPTCTNETGVLVITGTGFGSAQGTGSVTIPGATINSYDSWSDTTITVNIATPSTDQTSPVVVTTDIGTQSEPVNLEFSSSAPNCGA